jgi:hypothetical protein
MTCRRLSSQRDSTRLNNWRLKAGRFPPEDLEKLAILQSALSAVNEVIVEHQGRLG